MKLSDFKGVAYALPINVYKWNLGDCSNNGITSRNNELLLVGVIDNKTKDFEPLTNGFIKIDFNNEQDMSQDDLCLVVKRQLFGGEQHDYIVGLKDFINGKWCMMGGCFGYSCDSRWSEINYLPLPIHDRLED